MRKLIEKHYRNTNWSKLSELSDWVVEQAIAIQQIPAPTFEESLRAEYIKQRFQQMGLQDVGVDDLYNVYGRIPGQNANAIGIMLSAHIDTVFPQNTNLTIHHEDPVIYGPGLGDNSMGVAGLLGLIEILRRKQLRLDCDLWCVATSREEGLGNLDGMRAAFEKLKSKIGMVVNLEGLAFGHIYHAGIAVRRLHITAKTSGGHSWLHFGRPSAIHGIVQLGKRITDIQPPITPRTTYNIGIIEGGQSINTIAANASLWLDLRSEDEMTLLKLEQEVRKIVDSMDLEDLSFSIELVGSRPSGRIANDHPLVDGAIHVLEIIGFRSTLENGSTDGNIPLAAGYPTVTIGITRGGNAHRLDEYVDTSFVADGLKQLVTLILSASSYQTMVK